MSLRALLGPHAMDVFRFRGQTKARLVSVLQGVRDFGHDQVKEEMAKQ